MKNLCLGVLMWLLVIGTSALAQTDPRPAFSPQPPTYTTGDTPVSNLPLLSVAATVVPANLTLQAQAQAKVSSTLASDPAAQALGAKPPPAETSVYLPGCDPTADKFDWRDQQAISAPKDQGNCGDCFVFAAAAGFEASWFLQNKEQISVSEQQILDCAAAGDCSGGWHGNVFNLLRGQGVTTSTEIPYIGRKTPVCRPGSKKYTAINWGYVDKNGSMASPDAIKKAICRHGPVVSAVYATRDFQKYSNGVFNEFAEGNGSSSIR